MPEKVAEYDYVIAGGGSAGCTLAARLSEYPSLKVLLVEAGGNDQSLFTRNDTEEEAILIANNTIYGLAAGTWTRDTNRAIRIADRIQAGAVYINNYFSAATQSPLGGFKQSGYGRENGFEGMHCFMQTKSVWLATNPDQPDPFPAQ